MFCHYTSRASRQMISSAKQVVMLTQAHTLASPPTPFSSHATKVRLVPDPNRSFVTMTTNSDNPHEVDAIFQRKHSLRSKLRKDLKNMDPIWRSKEEQKKLYVPRVEDRNSYMRMLKISNVDDLVINSMNILEPSLVDCDGKQREDGLAFDRSGRRLGRSGGYYDLFLKKYQELAKQRKWKQPLLVALSYSLQIVDEGAIAVTSNDVPVDALVSPAGFIPMSPAALDRG